ncbi:uncharacterized protein LOC128727006 [Anopheles nili]|uniref:uncharacterized protein LOC128727006 n=1 Tax=Anopheles nili TaxID=185578 RepID=UPI00237AB49C|nr:uncharacterized protein LOC128727006 [Anopheles nili]
MDEVANTIDVAGAMVLMNSSGQQHDFKWTHERCMLLLHEYDLLKEKFKDRKHKKKDLWAEISIKFKKIYAYDLEWDVAYKKFRNLKQTFEQVRAKLHQQAITGQITNRPKWPYYEKFVQILDDSSIVSYSFTDRRSSHEQMEEQDSQQHSQHQHQLDPGTVGQVLGVEDFSDALVSVFPMGEELEIPAHADEDCVEEAKIEPVELGTGVEDDEDEEETVELEPPHRKRFRRRVSYQQERLEIEREKLDTLREIRRGIECKNDILRGILHVLQSRVWQAHPVQN